MKLIDKLLANGSPVLTGDGHKIDFDPPPAVVVADSIVPVVARSDIYGPLRCPIDGMWVEVNAASIGFNHQFGGFVKESPADPELWGGPLQGCRQLGILPILWLGRGTPRALAYYFDILINDAGEHLGSTLRRGCECFPEVDPTWYEGMHLRIKSHSGAFDPFKGDEWLAEAYFTGMVTNIVAHAVGFMNVKNVGLDRHSPPPKLSKAHQRRTAGPPLVEWTTIRLPSVPRESESGSKGQGRGQTPIHLVRGHFKTYTEHRPLFGRRTGTYWWPATVRGSAEHGARLHEYDVGAPGVGPPDGVRR